MGIPDLTTRLAVARTLAAIAALAILWTLEGIAPMVPARRRAGHDALNLGLGALNAAITSLPFAAALHAVSGRAAEAGFGLLRAWPLASGWNWVLALVLFDLWQYVWHLLNHRVGILWRFHAVHHSDAQMDASTALRFHTGEIILSSAARLVVLPVLGMRIEQLLAYELVLLPVILFHHSNVRVPARLDRALRFAIATPWMHRVHHSREVAELRSNFSSVLSVWDRLFATFRVRQRPEEVHLGLAGCEEAVWRRPAGVILMPFRRRLPGAGNGS